MLEHILERLLPDNYSLSQAAAAQSYAAFKPHTYKSSISHHTQQLLTTLP